MSEESLASWQKLVRSVQKPPSTCQYECWKEIFLNRICFPTFLGQTLESFYLSSKNLRYFRQNCILCLQRKISRKKEFLEEYNLFYRFRTSIEFFGQLSKVFGWVVKFAINVSLGKLLWKNSCLEKFFVFPIFFVIERRTFGRVLEPLSLGCQNWILHLYRNIWKKMIKSWRTCIFLKTSDLQLEAISAFWWKRGSDIVKTAFFVSLGMFGWKTFMEGIVIFGHFRTLTVKMLAFC